ncbi:MAG: InlB B-repeat-containing protein, partial [Finegoldia magna]
MRHSVRKEIKRFICFIMTMIMVLTSMPVHLLAAGVDYNNLSNNKTEIVNNKLPVEVAKPETDKTAADLIKNPDQAKIYTLRTDYKVPKNGENKINYQPYVASVGENATEAEKAKVNKDINLPDLKGYVKPQNSYNINFQDIVAKAKNPERDGFNFVGTQEFVYGKKQSSVKIVHKFQNLEDFNKYEENPKVVPTQQTGYTGSVLEVNPIRDSRIDGFEPEADVLPVLVPEDTSQFEVEFRYNRKTYEVNFKTDGGSSIPTRLVYFEQTIPTVKQPTRVGSKFMGWKPSVDLKDEKGNTFKANEPMKDSSGDAIMDFLKDNVKMPATDVTFTAVWDEEEKADYVIQFWTEKTDYDDKDNALPLRDRYDFIGSRRIDNADTGSTPDLTDLDIHGITFPDLNDGRLEKAQDSKEEFERYYFLNKDLTKKQNASKDNPDVQKTVLSTGETVYNVYYDRRVYTLYFTAANELAFDLVGSFWPIITRDGKVIGEEGSPYKVDVRFNQSLDKIWPKDEEVSNLPPASSEKGVDIGLIGWIINNNAGEQIFRDTPPYRLSAEDFIDAEDVMSEEDFYGYGHADQIPIKDGETKKRDKYEISIGSTSYEKAVVHHIDIIKDDFDGKEQIDYDMSYWKSDTYAIGADGYPFILPHLQGFTLKEETREAKWVLKEPVEHSEYRTIDDLNNARNKKTPFRSDDDKIEYIDKFPWGTKSFDGKNAYNYANYTRNKYKLKLNNDPKTVKNDSEYGEGNILDVPYEKPLKDLKLDTKHAPERPKWVPDDWEFKGWALDPAGENLIKNGKETKLHYDQVLYAKWTEPDKPWKITVDPN